MIKEKYKQLNIGQCFKNYKALQTFLEEPYKQGGKSRQLQLEDWQRYFDYTKEGYKYRITDVYDTPVPKTDHRGESGNRAIYSKHIEILLLDILQTTKSGNWTGSWSRLYQELGLVGENYRKYHHSKDSTNQKDLTTRFHLITQWELDQFYQRADNKLYSIVTSVLKSLVNKSLINLEEVIVIFDKNNGGAYVADTRDKKAILRVENEVLEEMGFETKSQVRLAGRATEQNFYTEVKTILKDSYDWGNYYKLIHILSNKDRNEIALTKAKKEFEQLCLNTKFYDFMQNNAEKEYQRMIDKSYKDYTKTWDNYFANLSKAEYTRLDAERANIFYPPFQYIEAQHLIGNITIPLDTEQIYIDYFSEQDPNADVEITFDNQCDYAPAFS